MSVSSGETIADLGEFGLIQRIDDLLRQERRSSGRSIRSDLVLGIGDDAAVLRPEPGQDWVITSDVQVSGRHFREEWMDARTIGRRAMMVNLSDLAAMGAEPGHAMISLGLPKSMPVSEVEELYRGFLCALSDLDVDIIGGNLTGTGPEWFCDLTLLGHLPTGSALTRSGAKIGDRIHVSGSPGRSAAGLDVLRKLSGELFGEVGHPAPLEYDWKWIETRRRAFGEHLDNFLGREPWARCLVDAYRAPRARIGLARRLRGGVRTKSIRTNGVWTKGVGTKSGNAPAPASWPVTALIDLSDGLTGDLIHLCEQSRTGAILHAERFPADPELERAALTLGRSRWEWSLGASDDYELLFTSPAPWKRTAGHAELGALDSNEDVRSEPSVPITEIGEMVSLDHPSPPISASAPLHITGLPPGVGPLGGWDHFRI